MNILLDFFFKKFKKKLWPFENLWNHFEVLPHKVFLEFTILTFHDFYTEPKNDKMRGPPKHGIQKL